MSIGEPKMSSENIEDEKNRDDAKQLTNLEEMEPHMRTRIDGCDVDMYIPEEGTVEMFIDGKYEGWYHYSSGNATADVENINASYDELLTKRFGKDYRDRCE